MDVVDVAARDRWVPRPGVPQAPVGFFLSALDKPERGAVARLCWPAGYLLVASSYQERTGQPLPGVNNRVAARAVPMQLCIGLTHAPCGWPCVQPRM